MEIYRKLICLFLFVFVVPFVANAEEDEWVKKGANGTPRDMVVINDMIIIGNGGSIMRSEDFGENWLEIAIPVSEDGFVRDFLESDGKNIYVMYYHPNFDAVYCSRDLGDNWELVLKKEKDSFDGIIGFKGNIFVTEESGIGYYHSTDGGKNWNHVTELIINGKKSKANIVQIVPFGDKIFIAPEKGGLLVSTDGMKTFKSLPEPNGEKFQIVSAGKYLLAGRYDYLRGNDFFLFVSADGGATWKKTETKFQSTENVNMLLSALEYKDVLYITVRGYIYRSKDQGATWENYAPNLLPFNLESHGKLCRRGNTLGVSGSVFFWTREIE